MIGLTGLFLALGRSLLGHFLLLGTLNACGLCLVFFERFAVHPNGGRVRPKYATNRELSWHRRCGALERVLPRSPHPRHRPKAIEPSVGKLGVKRLAVRLQMRGRGSLFQPKVRRVSTGRGSE